MAHPDDIDDIDDVDDPYGEPDPSFVARWAARASRPWLGWVLVGAGAVVILLGYLGVSRESIVAKQLPYLISGGIGGVLLCIIGAYVLGTEELRKDSGRLDRLERMVEELHRALLQRADAPATGDDESVDAVDASATVDRPRPARTRAAKGTTKRSSTRPAKRSA